MSDVHGPLRLVRAGIDTYQQPVVYMHRDCHVCRSEGFTALTRVLARSGDREVVATLNVVVDDHLELDVAALSEAAWAILQPGADAVAVFSHPEPPVSAPALRAKVFGQRLGFPGPNARHRQQPPLRHGTDGIRHGLRRRPARQ